MYSVIWMCKVLCILVIFYCILFFVFCGWWWCEVVVLWSVCISSATCYRSKLQHHVISSGTQLVGQGFVLLQDRERYIKNKEQQHVLQLISWPVQSADLNRVDELDQKFRTKGTIGKLDRTIFSLTPIFGGNSAENM